MCENPLPAGPLEPISYSPFLPKKDFTLKKIFLELITLEVKKTVKFLRKCFIPKETKGF